MAGAPSLAPRLPSSLEGEMEVLRMKSKAINRLVLVFAGLVLVGCNQNTAPAPAPEPTPPPAPAAEPPPPEPPPAPTP